MVSVLLLAAVVDVAADGLALEDAQHILVETVPRPVALVLRLFLSDEPIALAVELDGFVLQLLPATVEAIQVALALTRRQLAELLGQLFVLEGLQLHLAVL